MAWRSNTRPEPTLTELMGYIAKLEGRIAALERARTMPTMNGWHTTRFESLGDMAHSSFARDVATGVMGGETRAERRAPARAADFMSDVVVPFCWATISGLLVGIPAGAIAASVNGDWWMAFVIAGSITMIGMWAYRLIDHARLLWAVESFTHKDLNRDGNTGKPPVPPEEQRIELEVTTRNEKGRITGMKTVDAIGIDYDVLIEFLGDIVGGRPLTGPSWEGEAGSISQPKFTSLMLALERLGLVENKRGNVGRVLTTAGRVTLRCLVEPDPLPRQRVIA